MDVGITDAEGVFRCRYIFRVSQDKLKEVEDAVESDVYARLEGRPAPAEVNEFYKTVVVSSKDADDVRKEAVLITSISIAKVWLSVDAWS